MGSRAKVWPTMEGDPMNREEWLAGLVVALLGHHAGVVALPSFPAATSRNGRVCDLATDGDGRVLALVSPHLADSAEVGIVLAYLLERRAVAGVSRRLSHRQAARLGERGWRVDGWKVDPVPESAADYLARIDAYVARVGDYPAAPVAPSALTRQGTRMLALSCPEHRVVRVRATRAQIDAGAPLCGRDVLGAPCARTLVEV